MQDWALETWQWIKMWKSLLSWNLYSSERGVGADQKIVSKTHRESGSYRKKNNKVKRESGKVRILKGVMYLTVSISWKGEPLGFYFRYRLKQSVESRAHRFFNTSRNQVSDLDSYFYPSNSVLKIHHFSLGTIIRNNV